jgi:threonine dehydrogenase-like Zn-dependent dehydrogenase
MYHLQSTGKREAVDVPDAVRREHPDGVDVLIDLVNDGSAIAELASLTKPGGAAVLTRYAVVEEGLRAKAAKLAGRKSMPRARSQLGAAPSGTAAGRA